MSQRLRFHLVYDGPLLDTHKMAVRDLAPALLSLNSLVERANELLNEQDQARVSLDVHASFKSGSFGVVLELAQGLWQRVLDMATSHPVTGILQLAGLLGLGKAASKGLIQTIAWARGRPIRRITPVDGGKVRLHLDDEHLDVDERLVRLLKDYRIRNALEGLIYDPLQKEGIQTLAIADEDKTEVLVAIDTSQARYFKTPSVEEEPLEQEEYTGLVQVLTLAFQEGNKWRFTEGGGNTWYAQVSDEDFLKRVQLNQEHFAKDDLLKARIRRIQRLGKEGLKADYEILEVLEHRRASPVVQLGLNLDDAKPPLPP